MDVRWAAVLAAAAIAAAGAVSGCGGESDEVKAQHTVEAYLAAFADGAGVKACAELSPRARADAVRAARRAGSAAATCPAAVAALAAGLEPRERSLLLLATVSDVRVGDTTAEARLEGGDALTLVRASGGWRIKELPSSF